MCELYSIELLGNVPHLLEAAVTLYLEQWQAFDAKMSFDSKLEEFRGYLHTDRVPFCHIAILNGAPVGLIRLKDSTPEITEHASRWLSSFYVKPQFRHLYIGPKLARIALRHAAALGYETVYFFSDMHTAYQSIRGVKPLGKTLKNGRDLVDWYEIRTEKEK